MTLRTNWVANDAGSLSGGLNDISTDVNHNTDGTGTRVLTMNSPATGTLHLLRIGRTVTVRHNSIAGTLTLLYTLPLGFRPTQTLSVGAWNSAGVWTPLSVLSNGQIIKTSGAAYSTSAWQEFTFVTDNTWPATLPGVAA